MPLNLIKVYAELLDIAFLSEQERAASLQRILVRDIEDNPSLNFRKKIIRPIKGEEPDLQITLRHLTTADTEIDQKGTVHKKRFFEMDRSQRVHWIRHHLEERSVESVRVFSVEERDQRKRKYRIRTYLYDTDQNYIIVLDPQRSERDYYLITAYFINKKYGAKKMGKLWNKRLEGIH
jgi:hypothetical protein